MKCLYISFFRESIRVSSTPKWFRQLLKALKGNMKEDLKILKISSELGEVS